MIWKILIVDDDPELLASLAKGLELHQRRFSVLTARNVSLAKETLGRRLISLVVTDVKMPREDGFGLVTTIRREYPDVPFFLITGYGNPKMKEIAQRLGAEAYLEKPFSLQAFSAAVSQVLDRLTEGGSLQGVSPGMFLQLIEMEQKTCTIRLWDRDGVKDGVLYFREGELLDARTGRVRGEPAALEILGWEEVDLAIENRCPSLAKKFRGDIQAVLLEAMRRKDEMRKGSGEVREAAGEEGGTADGPPAASLVEEVRRRLLNALGGRESFKEITQDDTWDGLLAQMSRLGSLFQCGRLQASYMEVGENGGQSLVILPGENSISVTLDSDVPRDRVLEALTGAASGGGKAAA